MLKKGISLKLDVPLGLSKVNVASQQIQQVFLNILNNARYALNRKYPGKDDGKRLEITGEEVMVEGVPYVRIIFHDSGAGINSGILDKVMNPFFTTKPTGKGTGLGLSISHGIVKDHGGRLSIESIEGEYTKVTVDLPLAPKTDG
jgi:signal transduction histidine kinase